MLGSDLSAGQPLPDARVEAAAQLITAPMSRPLTSLQASMVLASLRSPGSGVYIVQDVCDLHEDLDIQRLKMAWEVMTRRHSGIRSGVDAAALTLCPVEDQRFEWQELDWAGLPPDEGARTLEQFLRADRERGFRLDGSVPIRFTAIRRSPERFWTLIWTAHHALLDGRSFAIVWREWFALYDGDTALSAEPAGSDFEDRRDESAGERFWREYLSGSSGIGGYILDRLLRAGAPAAERFAQHGIRLSPELTGALRDLASRHEVTVGTLVLAAWALLLARYSGRTDVVFGVTCSGRRGPDERVGCFINTLPLRVAAPPDSKVGDWLRQVRSHWLAVREHQHTPPAMIGSWAGLPAGAALFDTIVVYDREPPGETVRQLGGVWQHRTLSRLQRTDSPLLLGAYGAPALSAQFAFDGRLFSSATVAGLARHFETLLSSFVSQTDATVAGIRMLPAAEHQWLIQDRSGGDSRKTAELCVHELFEAEVQREPEKTALAGCGAPVSYSGLNRRANQLARLLRKRGAEPEQTVALFLDPSPAAVTGVLATVKSGAAFLPLDPELPPDRLRWMLDDAQPALVITGEQHARRLPGGEIVNLDRIQAELDSEEGQDLPRLVTAQNAAYLIYTSGSTGRPKAVIATHGSLANHSLAAARCFGIRRDDRRLQFASIGSDMFVAEVFNYLSNGATLVFGPGRDGRTLREFLRVMDREAVTITGIPSTWWHEWAAALATGGTSVPDGLRAVIVGMERVDPVAFRSWKRLVGDRVQLFNAYGPAETTCTATVYEAGSSAWENGEYVPIGRPLDNVRAYVLDGAGTPVPVGVAGELYIGGAGVARGYLRNAERSRSRFSADPYGTDPDSRVYRTGDIVFRVPDGNLVFVGRADRQVKIRGFRVELEEIEAVLAGHPSVRRCAVEPDGRGALVAYVSGEQPAADALSRYMARKLPAYMLPGALVILPELPLTPSGKIDRQALPRQHVQSDGTHIQEFSTATETRVAAIWREVLGVDRVRPDHSFFDLGGDSIRAARLLSRVYQEFGRDLPLAALAHGPTIANIAAMLDGAPGSADSVIEFRPRGPSEPLFCISSTADDPQCFRHLAASLPDDRPLCALGNPVRSGERLHTVEALAGMVCASIRRVRPRGPYLLGGYCLGGLVAFEAAQQLIAAGEEVRMVILFDTPAPGYPKVVRSRARYWRQLCAIRRGASVGSREVIDHLRTLGRLIAGRVKASKDRRFTRIGLAPHTADAQDWSGRLARMYVPKNITVPVIQFLAQDDPASTRVLDDPRLGWRDFSRRGFQAHRVSGTHATLLSDPHAGRIGAILASSFPVAGHG